MLISNVHFGLGFVLRVLSSCRVPKFVGGKQGVKFFSLSAKEVFMRDMTARFIAASFLDLTVKEFILLSEKIVRIGDAHLGHSAVPSEAELTAYGAKKRLALLEKRIALSADKEMEKLNELIVFLASKPDWISQEELKDILKDLRQIVATFFSSMELLREAGALYLDGEDKLKDFPSGNVVLKYAAEAKAIVGLLSVDIKGNARYLSLILKAVQRK